MADAAAKESFDALVARYDLPRVISMGRSIFDPVWREKEHSGKHSELLHVLRGSVDLVMRDCTLHGAEGDTLYTPSKALHRDVFPPQTTFEVYLVHFDWAGERDLLQRVSLDRLVRLSATVKAQLASDFRVLYQTFQRQGPLAHELAGLRLLTVLLTMAREASDVAAPEPRDLGEARRVQIMQQARHHIQHHFHEPLSLDDIAAALHISPYHLSHVFSAQSGFTLSSYLTSVRMERAAELLSKGRLPIREVARAVGYRDPQYFARVFGAHYGVAPSVYRVRR